MHITVPTDCDNAPKRRLIKDINLAYAHADLENLLSYFHQDIDWEMVGDQKIVGKDAVSAFLGTVSFNKADSIEIETIISHGKFASAMGKIRYGTNIIAFNDTYEFTSAGSGILKKIYSFAIPL